MVTPGHLMTKAAANLAATSITLKPLPQLKTLKPKLRGWIHLITAPLILAAGIVLIVLSPPIAGKVASAIFTGTALSLFTMSAIYHRGNWSSRIHSILRRIDHANIFVIIAGTYTPLAVFLLPQLAATELLTIVWGGAFLGVLAHMFWITAPRWVYVPVYIALGWVAIAYLGDFARYGSAAIVWLVISGGVAYTTGAIIYALKKPNPSLKFFGFHEIFHALTVVGVTCHTIAIFLAAATAS
ncbi:MAG: hemolysin III family protein [Promicromonosporaceae bacterium]|nr:hemolysin III family protein [Promicromonosporaceae bacterium]